MTASVPTLGLRANVGQVSLLVLVNAFVGGMVGIESSILPALAQEEFGLAQRSAILSFIAVFGISKAAANYFAGRLGTGSAASQCSSPDGFSRHQCPFF